MFFSLYLSIYGLRKGPGKFLMGVLESPGKVLDFFPVKEWEPCTLVMCKLFVNNNIYVYASSVITTITTVLWQLPVHVVLRCWFVKIFDWTHEMASKRDRDSSGASSGPPAKRPMTQFEPVKIGPIYSLVSTDFISSSWYLLVLVKVCLSDSLLVVNQWYLDILMQSLDSKC